MKYLFGIFLGLTLFGIFAPWCSSVAVELESGSVPESLAFDRLIASRSFEWRSPSRFSPLPTYGPRASSSRASFQDGALYFGYINYKVFRASRPRCLTEPSGAPMARGARAGSRVGSPFAAVAGEPRQSNGDRAALHVHGLHPRPWRRFPLGEGLQLGSGLSPTARSLPPGSFLLEGMAVGPGPRGRPRVSGGSSLLAGHIPRRVWRRRSGPPLCRIDVV